jgi:transcriptional regulator with XRE-family HTH domain
MLKENLKKLRQELGLSVAKLSEKIDIPAMTLTNYERGERTPSAQLFIQLNKKLNVNLNWFVSGQGEMFIAQENEELLSEVLNEVDRILIKYGVKKQ